MTSATNDIAAMVYMQPASAASRGILAAQVVSKADTSLDVLLQTVSRHGTQAAQQAERQLETLQDCFLTLLHRQLKKTGIVLTEKLTISLGNNQQLLLESGDDNEALLKALAADNDLRDMFRRLRSLAITAQGIHFLNTAHAADGAPTAEYRMCMKGALTHFYLR